jgi:hypothetical protein
MFLSPSRSSSSYQAPKLKDMEELKGLALLA